MADTRFAVNKAQIQFVYPFKIDKWESLRRGLCGLMERDGAQMAVALSAAEQRLEQLQKSLASGKRSRQLDKALRRLADCSARDGNHRCDADVFARASRRTRAVGGHFEDPAWGDELGELEIEHARWDYECGQPEGFMRLVCDAMAVGLDSEVEGVALRRGEDIGTRGYLELRRPGCDMRLRPETVTLADPESLPDLRRLLPVSRDGRSPQLTLRPTIHLAVTGFGCLVMKVRLANVRGLGERVDEIVFSASSRPTDDLESALAWKGQLAEELRPLVAAATRKRDLSEILQVLRGYDGRIDTVCVGDRLRTLVEDATVVKGSLGAAEIVDCTNLDRGYSRGQEPVVAWGSEEEGQEGVLEDFAKRLLSERLTSSLKAGLLADGSVREFLGEEGRTRESMPRADRSRSHLACALAGLELDGSTIGLEQHPYVSTFIAAPKTYKGKEGAGADAAARHFTAMLHAHENDLTRVLMKSKWANVSSDLRACGHALQNVFYSDLIYMAVDIRSTLCVYYTPASPAEYAAFPELSQGYKYREELSSVLQEQRMLWYAYVLSDQALSKDIRRISAALDLLKEYSKGERFPETVEGLSDVAREINDRKIGLAEVMEDPASRKGGSSLFAVMINRTSHVFRLGQLYESLHKKLDRLDMLGMHVNQTVLEYSTLVVQEGSRSAQLTLEFLEAVIIAFYLASIIHEAPRYYLPNARR